MLKPSLKKTGKSLKMPLWFLIFFDLIFAVLITCLFPGKLLLLNIYIVCNRVEIFSYSYYKYNIRVYDFIFLGFNCNVRSWHHLKT